MTTTPKTTRRTLIQGAAWSVPIFAVATASPMAAASQCVPEFITSTIDATFVRMGPEAAYFEWSGVFIQGDSLRLNIKSEKTSLGTGGIGGGNLTWQDAPAGSQFGRVPGAVKALNLNVNIGADQLRTRHEFSFTYAADGVNFVPFSGVSNASFTIIDIDGKFVTQNGVTRGVERVLFESGGSGVIHNPEYLTGAGTASSPWTRINPSNPDLVDLDTFSHAAGNIRATAAGPGWVLQYNGINPPAVNNFNIWITPIRFTATNPSC